MRASMKTAFICRDGASRTGLVHCVGGWELCGTCIGTGARMDVAGVSEDYRYGRYPDSELRSGAAGRQSHQYNSNPLRSPP